MSEPMDPLPPGIAELFAREAKSAIVVDAARQAAALARVSRSLDFALPPAAPAAIGSKVTALVVAAFLAGGVVGGAIVYRRPPPPAPVIAPIAVVVPPALPPAATVAMPTIAPTDLPSSNMPLPVPRPSAEQATGGLARERETLDAARAALVHGDQDEVMRKVREHEKRWPHGALEEEREALAIQALASSGQRAGAEERAARFRKRFPGSMLTGAVDAALAP